LSLPISFLFCFSLLLPPLSAPSLSLTSHPLLFLPFYNFYHFIFCSFSHLYFIFNHDMCLSFLPLHLSLFLPVILYSLLFPIWCFSICLILQSLFYSLPLFFPLWFPPNLCSSTSFHLYLAPLSPQLRLFALCLPVSPLSSLS
jgi:hypothetical protein